MRLTIGREASAEELLPCIAHSMATAIAAGDAPELLASLHSALRHWAAASLALGATRELAARALGVVGRRDRDWTRGTALPALLDRALKRLPDDVLALALPPLDIGASGEHSRFAGNLDLSVDTASRLWRAREPEAKAKRRSCSPQFAKRGPEVLQKGPEGALLAA